MWYIIPHTKTKITAHVHAALGHTGTRADFFFGMYQLETRFARITLIRVGIILSTILLKSIVFMFTDGVKFNTSVVFKNKNKNCSGLCHCLLYTSPSPRD